MNTEKTNKRPISKVARKMNREGWANIGKVFCISIAILIVVIGIFGLIQTLTINKDNGMTAYISLDGEKIDTFAIQYYQRLGDGWIRIVSENGTEYRLNEKNVIISQSQNLQ